MGRPDIVLIEDHHTPRGDTHNINAQTDLNHTDKYKITLLDVHCVADECKIDAARKRKQDKLEETSKTLRELPPGHKVEAIPITIGTRIPLVPEDIQKLKLDLGISETQAHKLFKDIWVCNTYYLRRIHTLYYTEQFKRHDEQHDTTQKAHIPSFPRRKRPDNIRNITTKGDQDP